MKQHEDPEKRADCGLPPLGLRRRTLEKQQQDREQQAAQNGLDDRHAAGREAAAHEHFAEHTDSGVQCCGAECKDHAFAEISLH